MKYSIDDIYMLFMAAHEYMQYEEIYFETDVKNLYVTAFPLIGKDESLRETKWEMSFADNTVTSVFILDYITVTAINTDKLAELNEKFLFGHFSFNSEIQRLTFIFNEKILDHLMPSTGSFHKMRQLMDAILSGYEKEIEDIVQ